ncbi:putative selenoprotein, Rdx type [Lupinus albus]|uniref:Putative selenoprotein, Rdx type n=1 Tax=Lupinus albus TaxID=3870 RepID=A0A6A4PX46_LUPAL|nr:putative selenoprotein, Rdx type [Lupinus albus]
MDRVQYVLVGLPLFLFFSDILSLFTTSPPPPTATKPSHNHNHHHHHHHQVDPVTVPDFPSQNPSAAIIGGDVGTGNTVNINFCSSCSYKGTAVTMKNMLEIAFPGTEVVLANYPPPLPKRLLSKVVPVLQFGVMGVVIGGEQIFPMLGFVAPPPWYNSLRANKFGTIASTWLLGNALQSFLHSSGAFEVYFNGELVFSKLKEGRFPGEIELKDLISIRMANSKIAAINGEGDLYLSRQE